MGSTHRRSNAPALRPKRSVAGRAFAAVAFSALLVVSVSCSSSSGSGDSQNTNSNTGGTQNSADTSGAKRGGTLTAAQVSISSNLAPTQTAPTWQGAGLTAGAIYGYLAYFDMDSSEVKLQFLKSMEPSEDFKTWTLTLHPGIKFSDGTPLDAAAVKYTMDMKADPNNGDAQTKVVASWTTKVVDETSLTVTLPDPDANFPAVISQVVPWVGSPTAWKKAGDAFGTRPVGAGPFKIESWTQNSQMTLERNPYYKEFAPGQPYLDKIIVKVTTQPSQEIAALKSGEAKAGWLQGQDQFKGAEAAGTKVVSYQAGGGQRVVFNTARAPFNDLRARQAVTYAMNAEQLAGVWLAPGTRAQTNLFPDSSPYYDKKYDFPKTDTAKAKKLFEELQADGVDMNIKFITTSSYPQLGAYVQATLNKYPGVHVDVGLPIVAEWINQAKAGQFDMTSYGMYFATPWPTMKDFLTPNGGNNYGKFNDPQVNKAVDTISRTDDPAVLKENYQIIAKQVATQLPFFPAQAADLGFAAAKDVHGVKVIQNGALPLPALLWMD